MFIIRLFQAIIISSSCFFSGYGYTGHQHIPDIAWQYIPDVARQYIPGSHDIHTQPATGKTLSKIFYGPVILHNQEFQVLTIYGVAKLTNVIAEQVEVQGTATLHAVEARNMNINGAVTAQNVKISENIMLNGSVLLDNTQVMGSTHINGALEAKKSVLHDIDIATEKIVLQDCQVGTITMKKNRPGYNFLGINTTKTQVVELDNTIVNGNIIFEEDGGVVILKNNAQIKGTVTRGVIQ